MDVQTVTGLVTVDDDAPLVDGHGHVWIDPPPGAAERLELNQYEPILTEVNAYGATGGTAIVDCQPGGCGRDANRLRQISQATGVLITATSGFHQRKYYPPDHWLWSADVEGAADFFRREVTAGMEETDGQIPATTLKVGYEGVIEGQAAVLMEAVAQVARQTGVLVLFHTERGRNVEALLPFFEQHGVPPSQLYMCHVDKRPDFALHRELAQAGVLLGYDTFLRDKYEPEENVWPLLLRMAAEGLADHIAMGLDLALSTMWRFDGHEHGMAYLAQMARPRLQREGCDRETIHKLTGRNVLRCLQRREVADREQTGKG